MVERGLEATNGAVCVRRLLPAAISAVTYNTTSVSTDASRAYYREGVVGAPGKLVVLRIYRYRYDELVRVVSYGLGDSERIAWWLGSLDLCPCHRHIRERSASRSTAPEK